MSRWASGLDDIWVTEGDRFFNALNLKLHPTLLPEGTVSSSVNKRFFDSKARPRHGFIMPWRQDQLWGSIDPSVWMNVKFTGSFIYTNPNGQERLILAPVYQGPNQTNHQVLSYDIANDVLTVLQLPPGLTFDSTSQLWFTQGMGGQLILLISNRHNGTQPPPPGVPHITNGLFWDGNEITARFQWFTWNHLPQTQVIPRSLYAFPVSDRIAYTISYLDPNAGFSQDGFVYDHVLISDLWGANERNPYQNLDPILQDFLINSGTSDYIVSVIPYAFDTLIVFMGRSICSLANFSVDPNLAQVEVLTAYLGCSGVRAVLQVGSEVYFMSERRGVFKLSSVLDKQIVAPPLPVSDPIQPVIDRINWAAQDKIVFAANDNYLYIAIPLDSSTACNCLLAFNLTTNNWESTDLFTIPHFRIDNILVAHIGNTRRLLAIQNGPPNLVYLMFEGNLDQLSFGPINPQFTQVPDFMLTRAYGLQMSDDPNAFKTFIRGSAVIETLAPSLQIQAIPEGVNEGKILRQAITKSPQKFYLHGVPDWTPGQNPLAPKRQDYLYGNTTLGPDNFAGQDFELIPPGDIQIQDNPQLIPVVPQPTPGINPFTAPQQNSRERFPIRITDRSVALLFINLQGIATIVSTSVEGRETRRDSRSAA